jgi:glycosyltransferase involved in cell wall biosynthesis
MSPLASVIIPAHNEEAVIARLLRGIAAGSRPGEFEIIVAANGCTDGTVLSARNATEDITVLDLPELSKVAALNPGRPGRAGSSGAGLAVSAAGAEGCVKSWHTQERARTS